MLITPYHITMLHMIFGMLLSLIFIITTVQSFQR